MDLMPWLKLLHILGAIIWVGGGVMLSFIAARARQSDDPRIVGEFSRTLGYVGPRVFLPAMVAVLVFGVWLVLASSAWKLTQLWILIALGGFIVAFLIGAVYLGRSVIGLGRLTAQEGYDIQAARDLIRRWLVGYEIVLVILLVVIWDMVFKPGL